MKIVTLILILFLSITTCFAQLHIDKTLKISKPNFKEWCTRNNLLFRKPESFVPVDSFYSYDANRYYIQTLLNYIVESDQKKIAIAFCYVGAPKSSKFHESLFPAMRRKDLLINNTVKAEADSINYKIIQVVDHKKLEKLGADKLFIYNVKVENKLWDKYAYCRKVVFATNDGKRGEVLFFYTGSNTNAKIDKEIKRTWGIFRFKSIER